MGCIPSATRQADAFVVASLNRTRQFLFKIYDFLYLNQEPAVYLGQAEDFFNRESGPQRMTNEKDSLGVRDGEFAGNHVAGKDVAVAIDFRADAPGFAVAAQAAAANLQRAQAFLQAFLERAADGHRFADAFHLRGERGVGLREFLEGEAGDFGHDVINARFEARGGFARDVILEFVEQVADGELGGDLRDGKAGGLGRERGTAADARVHLDDDHAAVLRADAELDVRAAGLDADGADDGEALVAHDLKFLVGQGLDGRDGDAVAGVDAHGIEVFDAADDDAVVGLVAHHFHFVFLPAEEGFFDENFVHGRKLNAVLGNGFKFVLIVTNAAARAAEREGRADDERETADGFRDSAGFVEIMRHAGNRHVEADLQHQFLERKTVFTAMYRVGFRADHFHVVTGERTVFVQSHCRIQGRLPAQSWQQHQFANFFSGGPPQGVHFLFLADDDFFHAFGRDGFDIGAVGELRVGHDGGRVGVDEDDAIAFLAQGFARLRAGIIELARLADDDRAGADDEDAVDVGAFGHN